MRYLCRIRPQRLELADVGAGREGLAAGTAHDDDTNGGIVGEASDRFTELRPHRERHGVVPRGIVEHDPADRAVDEGFDASDADAGSGVRSGGSPASLSLVTHAQDGDMKNDRSIPRARAIGWFPESGRNDLAVSACSASLHHCISDGNHSAIDGNTHSSTSRRMSAARNGITPV